MLEPHNLYEVVGSRFGTSFETVDLAPYPVPRTYSLWDKGDQSNFYMNGPWTKPLARQLRVLLLFYLLI